MINVPFGRMVFNGRPSDSDDQRSHESNAVTRTPESDAPFAVVSAPAAELASDAPAATAATVPAATTHPISTLYDFMFSTTTLP